MKSTVIFAGLLIAAGQAHASEDAGLTAERVSYQASELSTVDGVRSLEGRLRRAANRVCAQDGPTLQVPCIKPTMANAFTQLDRAIARWRNNDFAGAASIIVRAR